MNKTNILKLYTLVSAICIVILMVVPGQSLNVVNAAGPTLEVTGYAWSYHPIEQSDAYVQANTAGTTNGISPLGTQGFGWISMSGTNPGSGGGTYNVTIDPATGKFSGYGWSENGGWVNFAPTGPFPSATGTTGQSAFIDPACLSDMTRTCDVKGWIRFVNGGNSSWDGWVNMEIFNTVTTVYKAPLASSTITGVKLLPAVNGVRNFSGFAWGDDLSGIIGFSKAKIQLTDVCPDTNFAITSDPKNTGVDPKTAGTQTTMPVGYALSIDKTMCGIFGCTDKAAVNYLKTATIDDGSCILDPDIDICTNIPGFQTEVPAGYTKNPATPGIPGVCTEDPKCTPKSDDYNPFTKTCQTCNPNSKDYDTKTGLCEVCNAKSATYNPVFKDCRECNPSVATYNSTTGLCTTDPLCPDGSVIPPNGICPGGSNDPTDQCLNIEKVQTTVLSPYTQVIQAGVKNCYIIGCTDPYANNTTPGATMQSNPSTCTYDPGVETCKVRGDCPVVPTAPKKPIYIET